MEEAAKNAPFERNQRLVDGAGCRALEGKVNAAFALLESAVAGGYYRIRVFETEADLVPLRGDARWPPLVQKVRSADTSRRAKSNPELAKLCADDQADRHKGDRLLTKEEWTVAWPQIQRNDEQRRASVDAIMKAGAARSSDDFFFAAMIFQHGESR
jgi:hypothetical protein